jgi:hypothetical protein
MESTPLVKSQVVKVTSTICLLAGIWLFISPWVYGAYTVHNAWNSWIVGALMVIFAATRLSGSAQVSWVSWINCILAIWTFLSPWIYGYTGDGARFANSLIVGVIVFFSSIGSATALARMNRPGHEMHAR